MTFTERIAHTDLTPRRVLGLFALAALLGIAGIGLGFQANRSATAAVARQEAQSAAQKVAGEQRAVSAQQLAVTVCAIADFNRSGNPDVAPPSTKRGEQVAAAWQAFWVTAHCVAVPRASFDPRTGRIIPLPPPSSTPPAVTPAPSRTR